MSLNYAFPHSGSISILEEDNSVAAIYCHKARPDVIGCDLIEFYDTYDKVTDLISSGSIGVVAKSIEGCQPFSEFEDDIDITVFDDFESYLEMTHAEAKHYIFIDSMWFYADCGELVELEEFLEFLADDH